MVELPRAAEYDDLDEATDPRRRGEMLDEALEVITALWRGEQVEHEGIHYRVRTAGFRPAPVQRPRIPIWVGGFWPNRRPMRRAARWGGVFPLFDLPQGESDLIQLRECLAYIRQRRLSEAPFDVVKSGVTPGDDPASTRATFAHYEEAGVTWWLEAIAPYRFGEGFEAPWDLDALRTRVLQGPHGG